jgi:glycosyltransferase involved in cell wall biosynthesis
VVATTVGGIPEAVTNGVEALLVPPADPEQLAAAIESLAADAILRQKLGAAAAARAEAFDGSVAVVRTEAIYRNVV